MKINSRFAKVAVASGLVVATGAAVLGLTGFASAEIARNTSANIVNIDDVAGEGTSDLLSGGAIQVDGSVSAESVSPTTDTVKSRPQILAAAAEALGMTEAELVTELQSGKSIKQVADAKNVNIDTVIAKMTAAVKAHLDAEVASGEHTQAEADAKLAAFQTRVTEMVNKTGLPQRGGKGQHGGRGGHGPAKFATTNLATVLKLTEAELQTELKAGKTLTQIAAAQNVDIADVKNVLESDFKAHLDEEVASGKHTQAEADAKLAEFKTRIDDMVNGVHVGKGGHGGRGGHGRGHGHGPMGEAPAQPAAPSAQGTSADA